MIRFILPLVVFLIVAVFLFNGLGHNTEIQSPLIDKPAPAFSLPQLQDPSRQFSGAEMKGKVWLLNVWASWCESCRDEHPLLLMLADQNIVPISGLDWKDKREDGQQALKQGGNPYAAVVSDVDGRVGINFGVYGVPETYVIDKQGFVRYKKVGAITAQDLQEHILPLVKKLEQQS